MTDNFLIPDETCFCIFLYLAHRQGPGEKNQNLLGNRSFRLFSIMLSKGCYSRDGFWQECDRRVLTHIPSIRIRSSVPEGPSQWAQGYTAGSQLSNTTLQRWLSVEQSKGGGTKTTDTVKSLFSKMVQRKCLPYWRNYLLPPKSFTAIFRSCGRLNTGVFLCLLPKSH